MRPGAPDGEGRFPEGTFDARVASRLEAMVARARAFAGPAREAEERSRG